MLEYYNSLDLLGMDPTSARCIRVTCQCAGLQA